METYSNQTGENLLQLFLPQVMKHDRVSESIFKEKYLRKKLTSYVIFSLNFEPHVKYFS